MVHSVQNFMLDPTWPEVALLLTLIGRFGVSVLRRFVPVVNIIRSSKPDPGVVPDAIGKRVARLCLGSPAASQSHQGASAAGNRACASCSGDFWRLRWSRSNHFANGFGYRLLSERQHLRKFLFRIRGVICARRDRCRWSGLATRRFIVQPKWLGAVSMESGIIAVLILALMVTYLASLCIA